MVKVRETLFAVRDRLVGEGWEEAEVFHKRGRSRTLRYGPGGEVASFRQEEGWAVRAGDRAELFTHLAVPTMTRLRQPERRVLDTLVAAGVARSRADALAWCVRLVGEHTDDWLAQLRQAIDDVERIRADGPEL